MLGIVLALLLSAPTESQEAQEAQEEEAQEDGEDGDTLAEAKAPRFLFNGFATLGLAHSSEEDADFVANPLRPDGAGFTHEWTGELDNRLGLQLTGGLTPKLTAVVQVVVEQQHDEDFDPTLEWANLKYAFTEDFSLRIGRTALPIFAASDYRKVGYANLWARTPVELYSLVPISSSDGIEASFRHRFAGWTNTLQATLGGTDVDFPNGASAKVREFGGLSSILERGFLSLRAGHATGRIDVAAYAPLFEVLRGFGPEGAAIADRFELAGKRTRFTALSATYDPGRYFVIAELGQVRTGSLLGDRTAGYVTAGYRVRELAPYVTYSEAVADSPTSIPGLTLSGLPPTLVSLATTLNALLNEQLAAAALQRTVSLGVRWDFRKGAALKLQVDRIDVAAGSTGSFRNRQPFELGGEATIVSIVLDFVF